MIGAASDPRSAAEAQIEGTPTTAFGKYQLFASLGRGGMADVFLSVARGQMGFNKLAVIKRLRQALAEEAAFRTMFLDEARLAARLSHPNIVHTYEVGEQQGVYFIAMEYLEGQSLNKVLKEALRKKEALEPEIVARIIADALAGLHYAHELRDYDGRPLSVIHRDISPHNLFVTYDGHSKLVDFGIAKAALSSTETEVGVLKGKVAYMSPEQAMGTRIDARSDLFAMGIVLWELLARQRLMTGDSAANTLHKLINEPIPRLSAVVGGVDPVLDGIVARSLEKDASARYQSAADMREALERWIASQARPARQEEVGRKMQALFGSVREETQRQIQRYMAAINQAKTSQELQALTVESIHRMEQSGANVSGQLLRLGASGSGSGVVPNYGGSAQGGAYPSIGSRGQGGGDQQQRGSNTLLIVMAVGFFGLAALLIIVLGLRDRRREAEQRDEELKTVTTFVVPAPEPPPTPSPPAVVLPPNAAPIEPPVSIPTAPKTGRPAVTQGAPHASPAKPGTAAPPTNTASDEPGFLTLFVYPWAKVYDSGRLICTTPCNKVQLSPGGHLLTLENTDQGIKQQYTVTIKSGETTTKTVGLK